MSRCLVIIVGALVLVSGSTLPFDRAEAGASASAPSKYAQTKPATVHVATAQASSLRAKRSAGSEITEYSSSSAKTSSVPRR